MHITHSHFIKEDRMHNRKWLYMLAALVVLAGMVIWRAVPTQSLAAKVNSHPNVTTTTPIKHVVVIMMENRTFDHMFGRFPGVNGYTEAHAPDPTFDFEH